MTRFVAMLVSVAFVALAASAGSAVADAAPTFERTWGAYGSAAGAFNHVAGIATDTATAVFAVDYYNHRVQKFDASGALLLTWGSLGSGNGRFRNPTDVATDRVGRVYVADYFNHRIQKFDANGAFLRTWGTFGSGPGQFNYPQSVAVDPAGNILVLDQYNHRVQRFTNEGVFLGAWGGEGSGPGQFRTPSGLAVDASGAVYVADTYNNRVQRFTSAGVFTNAWGAAGIVPGAFEYPYGVAVDALGHVYVADTFNHRVQEFDPDGRLLAAWGAEGHTPGLFEYPYDVAVDRAGAIYVTDYANHRVQKFAGAGTRTILATAGPHGAIAPSGSVPVAMGSTPQFTITPEVGYHVADVQVDQVSVGAVTSYVFAPIAADHAITAGFDVNTYALGITVVGQGAVQRSPSLPFYGHGTTVTLTAAPAANWHFVGWGGAAGGAANPTTVTMDSAKVVTATFAIDEYPLTVTVTGQGTVTQTPDQATYPRGTPVTLTATPAVGRRFAGWSGAASGVENPVTVVVDTAKAVGAAFEVLAYGLDVAVVGQGAVAKSPDAASYPHGTVVTLTAAPAVGWHFVGWSGDTSGVANPTAVTMTAAKAVTATFEIDTYALGTSVVGQGAVGRAPDLAAYPYGTAVTLTAMPSPSWHFVGWSGDAAGSTNPTTVTMAGARTATATFAIDTWALGVSVVGQGAVGRAPDLAAYPHGTVVTLTATPSPSWHFVGWSGDAAGSTNPTTVTMTGARTATATFAIDTYGLGVSVAGQGAVARDPDQASYAHGAVVTLTATPAPGWHFVGWGGDAAGSASPVAVTMTGPKSVTATFEINAYALTVAVVGQGAVGRSPDLASYPHGSVATLTATPAAGWHFVGWSGDAGGAANPTTVTMTGPKSVTATFEINTYALTVAVVGQGTIGRSPDLAAYSHGTVVTLTATPAAGWHFAGWSGDASGAASPATVTMAGPRAVTATFEINAYTLGVTIAGQGAVSRNPDLASYPHGTVVTLTATPAAGWHFVSWSGDASGSASPTTVTMTGSKGVTATFEINTYPLAVTVAGQGAVTRSPDLAAYPHGTVVTLTATPPAGWRFVGWSGDASGTTSPTAVTMTGARAVTATFAIETYALDVAVVGQGAVARNPDLAIYPHGTVVALTATPVVGWHFVGWSGDFGGAVNPTAVTMAGPRAVTATFEIDTYALGVEVVGQGAVVRSPDLAAYPHGTLVTLTATPAVGWRFVGWSGDAAGATSPTTVTMTGARVVTATFAIETYALDVVVAGQGLVARNPNAAVYPHGSVVALTAKAALGWRFAGWSGDASGGASAIEIVMDRAKAVTATFTIETYPVTVSVVGEGTVERSPELARYPHGSNVRFTAVPIAGWHFDHWSGDASGATNPVTVLVDGEIHVTAVFVVDTYALDVTVVGSGAVTRTPDLPAYPVGSFVDLTAVPKPGWRFAGWSGDASGGANPVAVRMQNDKSVTATFEILSYPLDVTTTGPGTVRRAPDQLTYPYGAQVTLTAVPQPGYALVGWSGDATGTANPIVVTVDRAKRVSATFADLTAPDVRVLAPNGGDTLRAGVPTTIRWTATDGVGVQTVDLYVSLKSRKGLRYDPIALGVPNTGVYVWTVTVDPRVEAVIRIAARDAAGNSAVDMSDTPFTIVSAPAFSDAPSRTPGLAAAGRDVRRLAVTAARPNPARGAVRVEFDVARDARVVLSVVDVQGRVVASLVDAPLASGRHQVTWDGRLPSGGRAVGIYFVRLESLGIFDTKRVVVLP